MKLLTGEGITPKRFKVTFGKSGLHLITNNLSSINIANTALIVFDWKFSEIFERYRDIVMEFLGIYGKKNKVYKQTF